MSSPTKFLLDESKMPRHWYNIAADLPKPAPAVLHPGTLKPVGPDDLAPLFPMELILQEVSTEREVPIPAWLRQGLRYAPLATMAAIVVPEIVMTQGQLITNWQDARLPAAAVATAWFFWRRGILGTILSGTAVLLVLKLAFGW